MFGFIKKIFSEKDGFHLYTTTVDLFRDAYKLTLISFDGERDFCSLGLNLNEETNLYPDDVADGFGHSFHYHAANAAAFNNKLLHFQAAGAYLDIGYMVWDGVREDQYLRVSLSYNTGDYFGYGSYYGGLRGYTYKYDILDPDTFCVKSYDDNRNIRAESSFKITRTPPEVKAIMGR